MAQRVEAKVEPGIAFQYLLNFVLNALPGMSLTLVTLADKTLNVGRDASKAVSKEYYISLIVLEILKAGWMSKMLDFGGINNGETWVPGMVVFGLLGMALSRLALSGGK